MKGCCNKEYSTTRLLSSEPPIMEKKDGEIIEPMLFLPENRKRQGEGGLRTKGYFKRSYPGKPLISIITVVYNGEEHIEETIRSVIGQSYDNVEYIVIDGGSTDGTVDVIRKYEEYIDYWVSESDDGIYDAMNKGIMLAAGEWINFMNSGDTLYDKTTLADIAAQITTDTDLIYGDAEMRYRTFKRKRLSLPISEISKGMCFCHQSMYVRTALHRQHLYNLSYTICADYDFICKVYKNKSKFMKLDRVLASCSTEGVSDRQSTELLKQALRISCAHFSSESAKDIYRKKILMSRIKNVFKRYLPNNIVETIKRIK